jgi:hypothetical protein
MRGHSPAFIKARRQANSHTPDAERGQSTALNSHQKREDDA